MSFEPSSGPAPRQILGGVIHTYLKYDPQSFPSPTQPPQDFVSPLMEQMLAYGSMRELTEEELARAVRLDPQQFKNLGPSLDMIKAILEERKRKILETYETRTVRRTAAQRFHKTARKNSDVQKLSLSKSVRDFYKEAVNDEQLYDLERLWYHLGDDTSPFARHIVRLIGQLGDKYQIDELAAKYHFTGNQSMTIPQAIEIKEELEKIDELLRQLEEAQKTAQIAVLDMDSLGEFMDPEDDAFTGRNAADD